MSALQTYEDVFCSALGIDKSQLGSNLVYQSVQNWDSVGHMQLVSELEDAFDIMLDTDDIIDFSSYEKGKKILEKYGVAI